MKIWKYLFILVFVMDAWSQDSELSYQEMYTENGAQKLLLYGCKVYQDEETGTYQWFLESPFFLVETEGVRKLFDQEKETVTTIDQVFFQNCQIINVEDNPQIDSFSL